MCQVSESMLIDQVDETDTVIAPIERRQVFALKANFRVVHIFVLDRQGRLLLQQIPTTRKRHPGSWGSSVAGYVCASEDYETAADLKLFGKVAMHDEGCTKFISLFTTQCEGPFQPDLSHIAALEFLSLETIARMSRDGERQFTPTFLLLLNFFAHQGLVPTA
jgi:hypothetical protein